MIRRSFVRLLSLAMAFAVGALGPLLAWRSEHAKNVESLEEQSQACEAQMNGLEISTRPENVAASDLRARLTYGALDYFVAKACLHEERPVSTRQADLCWAQTNKQECYLAVARELLLVYRRHRPSWSSP